MAEEGTADRRNDEVYGIVSLLSSPNRDYLVRNNGDQVKIDVLKGKKLGLYFSASWCGPCHRFTPVLAEAYKELRTKVDFEVVFISADNDSEGFKGYFSMMSWLAIPFADSGKRHSLDKLFKVNGIPHLVIIDELGRVTTDRGVEIIEEHGVDAYPLTLERIKDLESMEEEAKKNQTINPILTSSSRDFVISADGNEVPVSSLEGKMVGIYFTVSGECASFDNKLHEFYEKLKADGESFEVVMVPLDDDDESFNKRFKRMPWLSIPVNDKKIQKLVRYFELETVPTLAIIGTDGKTICSNVASIIEEHGTLGYPFTLEKLTEIAEIEKAREEAQTLESLLVSGDLDYIIGKYGNKVPVTDLVGKNIIFYFSSEWCPTCQAFLPKLIEAYTEIKSKDDAFEVIFMSSDHDQTCFDEFYSKMPWLALPFGDPRKSSLFQRFKVDAIPSLVAIGPTGKTITKDIKGLITEYGHEAYPFTNEHVKKLEAKFEETAKTWPRKLKLALHEHELELGQRVYFCDVCGVERGKSWSYCCYECNYDAHPKCAFKEHERTNAEEANPEPDDEEKPEGWVCNGDVCYKA